MMRSFAVPLRTAEAFVDRSSTPVARRAMSPHWPRALSGPVCVYQRRATCSEGLPPTYAHRSGSTNPRHSKLLMRFNGGVCQSTASIGSIVGSIVGSIGSRAGTSGPSLATFTTGFTINRHVSPRHARPGGTRPFPRIPLAIEISGGWSDGEENASAALGAFEKPTGGSNPPSSAELQPLLELYFVACLMERTWRFCLPVVLAKAGGAVR